MAFEVTLTTEMISKLCAQTSYLWCAEKIVDAQNLPFNSDSFDAVFMVATDYYVPNIEVMFSEISRVLKQNGLLINASYKFNNLAHVKNQPTALHALKQSEYERIYRERGLQPEFKIILNNEPTNIFKWILWRLLPNFILRAHSQWLIHLCTKT